MSNFLKMAALLLCISFAPTLRAQTISDADQKGAEECYNAFMSAFDKLDASGLGSWFTENAEEINPMGEIVRGRANLVSSYTNLFAFFKTQPKPDRVEHNNTNSRSRYLAADLMSWTYTSENVSHFGDKTRSEKMSVSVLLRKTGSKWLLEQITLTPVAPMPGGEK
ncbi:MAG: nuclear transport factor 2 family protein [Saprospiraceae bacterium]|nr:nuclear transport factor 2 family protein [Saprospiraceae bacterium]